MHSSPPARAPKSKWAVEWPLTGGCWKLPKKDTPCPKTRSGSKAVGGAQSWQNQISCPLGGWLIDWRTIPKKFLHCCEGLEPHVRLHQSGELTKGLGIPRESDLSPAGFDHKTYTGMGETETWRAQTKPCMHQDSEERSSDSTGTGNWTKTTC